MSRTDQMLRFFQTEFPLNQQGLEELLSSFEFVTKSKGTVLLKEGAKDNKLRFINTGVIREYYVTADAEININFYTSPQFVTDFSSFIHAAKTKKNQDCLTEVDLLELDFKTFEDLLIKYDCGKSFIDGLFRSILESKELHEYNRLTKDAEALYKELCIYKPHWLQSIPQYHIASYLGITPETLSRIRKRIS
ncbi:MAG: Crp/Fnr family transcriptional regulator [Bacteroidota bacterium]